MVKKRPCSICGRWFYPHPRARKRQRVCSERDCQRERHRRNCKAWRDREAPQIQEERVRARLVRENPSSDVSPSLSERIAWDTVRDLVGMEVAVLFWLFAQHLDIGSRDSLEPQLLNNKGITGRLLPRDRRDDIGPRGSPGVP